MEIIHKGWDWKDVDSNTWEQVSEEFLPVAINWKKKFHSVLDIGTGKGRHAFYFAGEGMKVSAVDLSETSIEYVKQAAKQMNLSVDIRAADMTKLPFEDKTFDCVICFHTIYHTDYNGVKQSLAEIWRVLNNHGEAFISFNSKENPHFIEQESIDGYTMLREDGLETGIPHCYLNQNDVFALLSGFDILSMSKVENYMRKGRNSKGIHYFVHIVKK
jgi:SAM-dependent methyltransferase